MWMKKKPNLAVKTECLSKVVPLQGLPGLKGDKGDDGERGEKVDVDIV